MEKRNQKTTCLPKGAPFARGAEKTIARKTRNIWHCRFRLLKSFSVFFDCPFFFSVDLLLLTRLPVSFRHLRPEKGGRVDVGEAHSVAA